MFDRLSLRKALLAGAGNIRDKAPRTRTETPPVVLLSRRLAYKPQIDWDVQPLLGKVPDAELAKLLGCQTRNVKRARVVRGIGKVET